MDIEKLKRAKSYNRYTLKEIAIKANLPLRTVENVFSGSVKTPRTETIKAIEKALGIFEEPVMLNMLTENETRLLAVFKSLSPVYQETIIDMCESLAAQSGKTKRN